MSKKDEWIIEGLLKKGGINIMNVAHDGWCNKLKQIPGECNCDPDIKVTTHEDDVEEE